MSGAVLGQHLAEARPEVGARALGVALHQRSGAFGVAGGDGIGDEAGQVAVEVKAGHKVAHAFKGVKAAIHQNHGLLTASRHSIESAAFWFIALERCCQQELMVDASGHAPRLVPPERARESDDAARQHPATRGPGAGPRLVQ